MVTGRTVLLAVGMLTSSIWIGSLVSLVVVSSIARRELDGRARVALFRSIGRSYQVVGTGSLVVSILIGVVLAWPLSGAGAELVWVFALSGLLLAVLVAGMVQAKRMTARRRAAIEHPDDVNLVDAVRRGAIAATVLRSVLGIVTLLIVVLGAHLIET